MKLYNLNNINIINENLTNIQKKGNIAKSKLLEPNIDEYLKVSKDILNFIKEKKRVIYGGKCWEALLKFKNKDLKFYEEFDMSDYEFYSYEPLKDLKELCDLLHEKGYKYVEGVNAQHEETFKVRVNYIEYCDITYIPKIIFGSMPKLKINGLIYTGFNFLIIDILRIFNDPLSSYWRIEKNGKRALELFKYYSLNLNPKFRRLSYTQNVLDYVRKELIINSQFIIVGYYAFNYYKYISMDKDIELYVPYYEIISTNFIKDVENISNKLEKKFKNIKKSYYHPFYQFLDRKISFFIEDKLILTVYGNNEYCIPYKVIENKNINIASYNVTLMYFLINSLYYQIYENKEKENIDYLIKNLIEFKNNYLEKNKKTPLDDTPFQEFFTDCLGETFNSQIKFFKSMDKRNKNFFLKNNIGRYHPGITKNFDYTKFNFKNTSGNIKN